VGSDGEGIREQQVMAVLAGLLAQGVPAGTIERACTYAADLRPGRLITAVHPGPDGALESVNPREVEHYTLWRAFVLEQVGRLGRSRG
jgi:hypothetical protein